MSEKRLSTEYGNHPRIRWDRRPLLENNDITGDQVSCLDLTLLAVTNDYTSHRNARLQLSDNVTGLPARTVSGCKTLCCASSTYFS